MLLLNGQPIRTADPFPIAVLSQDRLPHFRPGQIIVENFIHHQADTLEKIPAVDPLVVKGGGGSNGKIIALVPIKFGVNPVHGKGQDGQHIGDDGGLRPGGINFAAGHVFDVIPVRYIIIGS